MENDKLIQKQCAIHDNMNSILDDLEKLISKYSKAQKNAVDEFDDNVNYGKVRALKEAIEVVKKHRS